MVLYHNYILVHFHSTLKKRLKRLKGLALTAKLLFPLLIKRLIQTPWGRGPPILTIKHHQVTGI